MSTKPRILILNDDGIHAPGINHLWRPLVDHADVTIIAPATEQSSTGMCTTFRHPLHVESVSWEKGTPAWKVTGTPADCVKMALSVLLQQKPDLIVSGINRGANSGRNVLYSGTVGGVIEGALRGVPGIAFSCVSWEKPNYNIAEKYILPIVKHVRENPMPYGTFLNVNVPDVSGDIKGFKMARQGKGLWIESPDERVHPEGRPYYWLGGRWDHHEEHAESDVLLLDQGYLTAVPIHIHELTDHDFLKSRKTDFEKLFS